LSCEATVLRVDPVIPSALDGLRVEMTLRGRPVQVSYQVGKSGCGVTQVSLNGQTLPFTTEANPHRRGAALVELQAVLKHLQPQQNALAVHVD